MLECWARSEALALYWNFGILGCKIGKNPAYFSELKGNSMDISPIIHYSTIPLFQKGRFDPL
jgi:hypothetical protein